MSERGELLRALASLAEPPAPEQGRLSGLLGIGEAPPDPVEHTDLFLFRLYPHASVHLGADGMIGGEALDRVTGFWRSVGRDPPPEPDHLTALLTLYAALLDEGRSADGAEGEPERRRLAVRGSVALLHEHLTPWVFIFLDRVSELGSLFYRRWASLLGAVLEEEVRDVGARGGRIETLPLALAEAPGLPDPREFGAKPFVGALFAPARVGAVLTRSELSAIARRLGVGLRAGERRYALEHLLGQDPGVVLRALAAEIDRQRIQHEARASVLGTVATEWARRARIAAGLLEELAADDADVG